MDIDIYRGAWKDQYLPGGLYDVNKSHTTLLGTSGTTVPCVCVPE